MKFDYKSIVIIAISVLTGTLMAFSVAMNMKNVGPDFAFPKKVVSNSLTDLEVALKTGNGPKIVGALIQYTLAECAVDPDSLPDALKYLSSTCEKVNDIPTRSLLYLLEAQIYTQIYTSDRWKYDSRELPVTPLPENYNEWSGEQFKDRIIDLIQLSSDNKDSLQGIKLENYKGVLTTDRYTFIYYPTLYDFVSCQGIELCKELIMGGTLYGDDGHLLVETRPEVMTDSLYRSMITNTRIGSAPNVKARLDYMLWIGNHSGISNEDMTQRLFDLYNELSSSEYSGDILKVIADRVWFHPMESKRRVYDEIVKFIEKYPDYYGDNCLRNSLKNILQPTVKADIPRMSAPGIETEIKVKVRNATNFTLAIYNLPTTSILSESWTTLKDKPHKLISRITKNLDLAAPFDTVVTIKEKFFPKEGYYVVVTELPGVALNNNNSYPVVYCTRCAIGLLKIRNSVLVALDPLTGAPISGGNVKYSSYRGNSGSFRTLGMTDSNGFFDLGQKTDGMYGLDYKGDIYTPVRSLYQSYNDEEENSRYDGEVFTALSVYRPGDRVNVAAIAYTFDRLGRRPLADNQVCMIVRDANYQVVDTLTATTDAFGRMEGEFFVPEGRLTGNYYLTLYTTVRGEPDRSIAKGYVMVSDYKLPSFKVEITDVMLSTPEKGAVTIKGKVTTYSGFGLSDATLSMNLSVNGSYWWWRMKPSQNVIERDVRIGSDGSFETVIEKQVFDMSPYPKGLYTAVFTATAPAGETQIAERRFAMGEAYTIKANIPSSLEVTKPINLDVKVYNAEEKSVDAILSYTLSRNGEEVKTGTLNTSYPTVDFSDLSPAIYSITLKPTGDLTELCDSESYGEIAIYRTNIDRSPSDKPLWTPKTDFTVAPGSKVKILYGTPGEESHILLMIKVDDKDTEYRWIHESSGLHTLEYEMPDAMKVCISMASTYGYRDSQISYILSNPLTQRKLKIERESFRDNLVPGQNEKWVIRISGQDDTPATAAVIVDMYNRALDAIVRSRGLHLSDTNYPISRPVWNSPSTSGNVQSYVDGDVKYLKCNSIDIPGFNLYGRTFSSRPVMMYRSMKMMSVNEESVSVEEDMMDSAPMMKNSIITSQSVTGSAGGFANDDAVVEEEAESIAQDTGATDFTPDSPSFEFRDAEVPLAFFRPMLTTDPSGRLTLEFKVPNANAAWSFNALAWTDEMVVGSTQVEVTTAKPIMVQPNLPRFLRSGDKAIINAMVMNNSNDTCEITTIVEVFDPVSGENLQPAVNVIQTLAPDASGVAEMKINVPDGITMIGYRVKSVSGDFADGEQTAIPVLPSTQPVIESHPFYIAPESHEFQLKMAKMSKDARVTLQFCENPAWYVVTALPGLSSEKPRTAIDAAIGIFSTSVAEGIIRSNPNVAHAIKEWSESQRNDSVLVSMLERNQDLKTVLLQATPWMMDARSDTERMERLVLLFDSDRCKNYVNEAVDLLSDLQQSDGGWGWTPQFSHSSQWVTYLVLDKMGGLLRLNFMPDNPRLREMIVKAVNYTDSEVVKSYDKYPDSDYRSYTTMRDLFNTIPQSSRARHISEVTVQKMLKSWKKYSVEEKAFAAMTFFIHGYKKVSEDVLRSLREYSVYDPSKGMWWPSEYGGSLSSLNIAARILDAIILIDPKSQDIDRIRQWLIFEKEARNWGDGSTATAVIGSFLAVSDKWISPASGSEIKVGNRVVEQESFDKTLGYFRSDISALNPSGATLKVIKPGNTPAWGAVFQQYSSSMNDISAESCDAVSVEKRISAVDRSREELQVGDRVRVQLIITASRTLDYVAITDERAACLAPVDQIPGYVFSEGIGFYRENLDSSTRLFIDTLPKGTYILSYDMFVSQAGRFSSGMATVQSQYAPAQTAHSGSKMLRVNSRD